MFWLSARYEYPIRPIMFCSVLFWISQKYHTLKYIVDPLKPMELQSF